MHTRERARSAAGFFAVRWAYLQYFVLTISIARFRPPEGHPKQRGGSARGGWGAATRTSGPATPDPADSGDGGPAHRLTPHRCARRDERDDASAAGQVQASASHKRTL